MTKQYYVYETDTDLPAWIEECIASKYAESTPLCEFPKDFRWDKDLFKGYSLSDRDLDSTYVAFNLTSGIGVFKNKLYILLKKKHWIDTYIQIATHTITTSKEIQEKRYTFSELQEMGDWYSPLETFIEIDTDLRKECRCGICNHGLGKNDVIYYHYPIVSHEFKTWLKIGSKCIRKFLNTMFVDSITREFKERQHIERVDAMDNNKCIRSKFLGISIIAYNDILDKMVQRLDTHPFDIRKIFYSNVSIDTVEFSLQELVDFFVMFSDLKQVHSNLKDPTFPQNKERKSGAKYELMLFKFKLVYENISSDCWENFYEFVCTSEKIYYPIWFKIESILSEKRPPLLDFLKLTDMYDQLEKAFCFR